MLIEVAIDFRHNCINDPIDGWAEKYTTGGSYTFEAGTAHEVSDKAADYFIRAGWASKPGEQVVKPDPTKPVFIQPNSVNITTRADTV